jgi:glyoxylase-like metal-dependent hydrolase (beta-lactamase superfamily II)/rhodanese-related sulfurtransferase
MTPDEVPVVRQLNEGACRTYLVGSTHRREAALVDPVLGSTDRYLRQLREGGWQLRWVIDTHTHADHLSGCRLLAERTGAEYAMHRKAGARHASTRLTDGSTQRIGDILVEAIETPGHTKDSLTLKLPGRVLTGDWLFIGGAGRTDLPGGDPGEHWDSLSRVIPSLDETTLVLPGHDYNGFSDAVLGAEKRTNEHLQQRSRDEYVAWLSAAAQPTPAWMIETLRANNAGPVDPTLRLAPPDAASVCASGPAPAPRVPQISVDQVRRRLDSEGPAGSLLLDVRQPEEYTGELGHVPGAVLIPLSELPARIAEIAAHRAGTVITVCRSGNRSAHAAAILRDAGFADVWNMTGGTLAWRDRGLPLER